MRSRIRRMHTILHARRGSFGSMLNRLPKTAFALVRTKQRAWVGYVHTAQIRSGISPTTEN